MRDLAVLIPTRGRPGNIRHVISAWDFTNAWDVADMVLIIDQDDPELDGYHALIEETRNPDTGDALIKTVEIPVWEPMVHKLDSAAVTLAPGWFALGFAGDDHLPRTINWAKTYLAALRELKTGLVYGDDGYQHKNMCTEWAVTSDVVLALGRMIPAPVEHMWSDVSLHDLMTAAGAISYLPQVQIEHMHPIVGKSENDEQYRRVNSREQFARDRKIYDNWKNGEMSRQLAAIKALRPDRAMPPRKEKRMSRSPFPRYFKQVAGATPEEIGIALADFASQVPKDQEIVELGVYRGKTALQMAWGAQQGNGAHVTAIDAWDLPGNTYGPPFTDPGTRAWARYWVNSLGYSNHIRLVHEFSADAAARWVTTPELIGMGNRPIGLLFVDDDHSAEGARSAIMSWAPHLAPGARIAVDDYGHPDWPGVAEAVDALVAEGVLMPIEIYHDRLAVTRLTEDWTTHAMTPEISIPRAITSEGVSPSPEPDEVDRLFQPPPTDPGDLPEPTPPELDRQIVHADELGGAVAAGTPIESLNLGQLRALAKVRHIVLGARKDLKADIIQALRDGR